MYTVKKLLSYIFSKKIVSSNLSTELAIQSVDPKTQIGEEVKRSLKETGRINAAQMKAVCLLWFGVNMDTPNWKFRENNKYGQYFEIKQVSFEWGSTSGEILDMTFKMEDAAYTTSLVLSVSIKDLTEWMEPLFPSSLTPPGVETIML